MTVISSTKDAEALKLVFVAEFDAAPERVWKVWSDSRQLERWWGPPGWPATFVTHDFTVDGQSRYFMSGPEGERSNGYWRIIAIDEPNRLELDNGLAGDDGEPLADTPPMRGIVSFERFGDRTRMTIVNEFVSVEQMDQMLGMGMLEGMQLALGQIDRVLS
jgi:uncharacterized protein YndB with AHSA1/START domain